MDALQPLQLLQLLLLQQLKIDLVHTVRDKKDTVTLIDFCSQMDPFMIYVYNLENMYP